MTNEKTDPCAARTYDVPPQTWATGTLDFEGKIDAADLEGKIDEIIGQVRAAKAR